MVTKADFDNKLISLDRKINSNKTKHLLAKNEFKKLQPFDSNYFKGKSRFEEYGVQNYLLFQPIYRYFKKIRGVGSGEYIYFRKSAGLSGDRINSITASNYSITPKLSYYGSKVRVRFNRSCLEQDKITYTHEKTVNIYIVYEKSKNFNISSYSTLKNCLFVAVSLNKNFDINEYKYYGFSIRFDRKGTFSFGNVFGRNCIISGVEMSCSVHVDNKKKDILIFGEGPTQELDGTTLTAEKNIQLILLKMTKKFV